MNHRNMSLNVLREAACKKHRTVVSRQSSVVSGVFVPPTVINRSENDESSVLLSALSALVVKWRRVEQLAVSDWQLAVNNLEFGTRNPEPVTKHNLQFFKT